MYNFPWIKEADNEYVFYYKCKNGKYIVIRFSEDCIRFYWRNEDYKDLTFPENQQIFSIDLSSPKTIGNDLLAIKEINETLNQQEKVNINDFVVAFVTEIENDEGIFATSSTASRALKKLQTSTVYRLIATKKKYETYSSQKGLDLYEYNRRVSEYVDLLMSPKLPAILPPDKVGKDCLFENPEYELQRIMKKDTKIDGKKNIIIKTTRKEIQSFFFLKHSTINAYYQISKKVIYIAILLSMLFWSSIVLMKCTSNAFLPQINYFCLLIVGAIVIMLFLINALCNGNNNSLYPRIVIALIASWTLIVLSGDFVFSFFVGSNYLAIYLLMLFLFTATIFTLLVECKEYSPYYAVNPFTCNFWKKSNWVQCNWKTLPVFSFSIFLSLFMGIGIQLVTFTPLLKTGNTLYSVTFSSEFKNIEHHIANTQLLIDNLEAYKREITVLQDSTIEIHKIHTNRKSQIDTIRKQSCKHHDGAIKALLDSITNTQNQQITILIDSLLPLLHSHLHNHQNFIAKYYDADSLLNLCCDTVYRNNAYKDDIDTYNNFFKAKGKEIQESIVPIEICCVKSYLFPKLLVFHALLAVLIAFIVQIIFTGKSVTEGL